MNTNSRELFGSIESAQKIGISLRQLYHWVEHLELVSPKMEQCGIRKFRRFSCADVELLRKVKKFLDDGYTLQAAAKMAKKETEGAQS